MKSLQKLIDNQGIPFFLLLFCFSAFLLLQSCTSKKNNTLSEIVAVDSLFESTGDAKLDSLLQLTVNAPIDTNLAKLYFWISEIYLENDFEKAKDFLMKMKNLSDSLNWNKGRYEFAHNFADVLRHEGLIDSAIVIEKNGLELAKNEKNEKEIAFCNFNLGTSYLAKHWYETALQNYMEALPKVIQINDSVILTTVYCMLSELYRKIENLEKATEYAEKAVALNNEDPSALFCLGVDLKQAQHYEQAKDCFEKALSMSQDDEYLLGSIYYQLGIIYLMTYDLSKSSLYTSKSQKSFKSVGVSHMDCAIFILLGYIEEMKGNFIKAEKYFIEALQLVTDEQIQEKKEILTALKELSLAQQNFRQYLKYWDELYFFEQEISKDARIRAAEEFEVKYETEKKQLEIEKQQQINKLQRSYFMGGIAVCILVVALLWFLYRLRNRQKQTLAEMNATKDKFFTIISHDLKNPAIAQREALQMLLENAKQWNPEQLEKYCHGLMKSADGLVDLLYNLLNWAQLQTGRMLYKPVLYDIAADIRDSSIAHFTRMAEQKEIELIAKLPETALITGDINMLKTVVRNLIDNAIKFTPRGGQIILEISQGTGVSPYAPTRISISDTGIGMTEKQIRHIIRKNDVRADFKSAPTGRGVSPYASTRGTAGESGTGLGLTVCKELLEKHGTTLHIESTEGKGSTFWFEI